MRVLMIVQEVNEAHWLRGFTVGWIRALAAEVAYLEVLTLENHGADLPRNVRVWSMGKEEGKNRRRELWRFYKILHTLMGSVDVVFSHMTPRYTWLAAPYAARYGKPQLLWYTHPKANWELRLAAACAHWIATADPSSFPLRSSKVHALGHGIDTARYIPAETPIEPEIPTILAVGRVTPAKQHHILLEAIGILKFKGVAVRGVVVGSSAAKGDAEYQADLLKRRGELGLDEHDFDLHGALSAGQLIRYTQGVTAITNLSPDGYFDKAALEGMLIGKPLITANAAFLPLMGEHADLLKLPRYDDPQVLAAAIERVIRIPAAERQAIGLALRERTAAAHGLRELMKKMVALVATPQT